MKETYHGLVARSYSPMYRRYSSPKDWLQAAERDLSKRCLYEYWEWLASVQGDPYPSATLDHLRRQAAKEAKKLIWC